MMSEPPVLIAPIRKFGGMTRLSGVLDDEGRAALSRALADRLITAGEGAGLRCMIVTADHGVERWASEKGIAAVRDVGSGLNAAVEAAVASVEGPWIVAHADLPFVTAAALGSIAALADRSAVLVPSLDGGTTIVAGHGSFPFSFGTSSFHRHLASVPSATVRPSAALSIDVDTPGHLAAFQDLERRSSLTSS